MDQLESFSDYENKVDEKKYMHQSAGVPAESRKKIVVPRRRTKAGNTTWQKKARRDHEHYDDGPVKGNYVDKVS